MANQINGNGKIRIRWAPQAGVPAGGYYHVFRGSVGGGAVQFDADHRLSPSPVPAWSGGRQPTWWDDEQLAASWWSLGGSWWNWSPLSWWNYAGDWWNHPGSWWLGLFGEYEIKSSLLPDGQYKVAVVSYDPAGNADTAGADQQTVTIAADPQPATDLAASAYDSGTDTLTLTWTLSEDDQAA